MLPGTASRSRFARGRIPGSLGRQREEESGEGEADPEQSHPAGGPVPGHERDVEGDVVGEPDGVDEQFRQEDVEEADGERAPSDEAAFG